MEDIQDYIKTYYGVELNNMLTLDEFDKFRKENGYEEWDYPLEEYGHIAENELTCVPVRFKGTDTEYDYRFCEVPEKWAGDKIYQIRMENTNGHETIEAWQEWGDTESESEAMEMARKLQREIDHGLWDVRKREGFTLQMSVEVLNQDFDLLEILEIGE